MSKTWYFVRHGETTWNKEGRKQGWSDSPLTMNGIASSVNVAEFLKRWNMEDFDIISSPLGRAQQTAAIISEVLGKSYSTNPLLKEHSFGFWEGMTEREIEDAYPGYLQRRYKNDDSRWNFVIPGGESYDVLYKRIRQFCCDHILFDNLIIITHEMVSKTMRGYLFDMGTHQILHSDHKHGVIYAMHDGKMEEIHVPSTFKSRPDGSSAYDRSG